MQLLIYFLFLITAGCYVMMYLFPIWGFAFQVMFLVSLYIHSQYNKEKRGC